MLFTKHRTDDLEKKANVIFNNITLHHYCTEEQKKIILENLSCRSYQKGDLIFYEGQPSYLIYFVYSGVVKLWKEGLHKYEQIIRFAKDGDMIGFWGSLENKNYSLSSTAIVDSELFHIRKEIFLPIVNENSGLNFVLHDYIVQLKKTEEDLRNMAEMNIREKVAHSLLELLGVFKDRLDNTAYKTVLSRKEIAALSSVSEDRVSKQLSEFKKENIIHSEGDTFFIDQRALQEIIKPYIVV